MGTKSKASKKAPGTKSIAKGADRLLPKGRALGPHNLPDWAIKAGRALLKKVPNATAIVFEDSWVYAIEPRSDGSGYVLDSTGVRYEVHEFSAKGTGKPELIENYIDYATGEPSESDAVEYALVCAESAREMALEDGPFEGFNLPRTIVYPELVMQGLVDFNRVQSAA